MTAVRVRTVPANEASPADLQAVFGDRGTAALCRCQRYKLARGESFRSFPAAERAERLLAQARCGDPAAPTTSGLVAYADGNPVGWCAVEPRPAYTGLVRTARVPWQDRDEDPEDDAVWAVTCVLVRAGRRRRGIGCELVAAAVEHARAGGARAIEAYPMTTKDAIAEELHVGTLAMFLAAGFEEVTRPTKRRAVVRLELGG